MPHPEPTPLALHPFKGLAQTAAALFLALLVTAVCWSVWAYIAHRRLNAQIAAITALHQPFWESDYPSTHIPDDRNAAVLWKAAFDAYNINDTCPANSNYNFSGYPPFSAQWHQLEDQSIAANANLFVLVHQAAAVKDVDWGEAAQTQATPSPYFNVSRGVANVLGDAILHAHLHGNDVLAIQRAQDLIQLARADGATKNLMGRLVSLGIQSLCSERLMCATPDLVIERDAADRAPRGPTGVSRGAVQSLIRMLLDESTDAQSRTEAIDWVRTSAHGDFQTEKKPRWTLGPLIDLSEARTLIQRGIDRRALAAPSETTAATIFQSNPTPSLGSGVKGLGQPKLTPGVSPRWAGIFEDPAWSLALYAKAEWRQAADRRCAAIALAIRLYRADHQEAWPATLAELVPAYLPAVPDDPFAPTPSPIGYIIRKRATPEGGDRPMLYFDLSGNPATMALPPNPNFCMAQPGGQWRDLSRWYPVVPTTSTSAP
jgi:hypothetical protein